ncbi:hypothetical protein M0802_016000 [Mischocyttarus mexicanus]|nr:hypothetical protein M0802_016000 [Mischocyttarus mexicanus]
MRTDVYLGHRYSKIKGYKEHSEVVSGRYAYHWLRQQGNTKAKETIRMLGQRMVKTIMIQTTRKTPQKVDRIGRHVYLGHRYSKIKGIKNIPKLFLGGMCTIGEKTMLMCWIKGCIRDANRRLSSTTMEQIWYYLVQSQATSFRCCILA